jgi:NADH dehydrogenase/NADH:ubiquinone oxidoreductase subunit G
MPTLTIDGRKVRVKKNATILDAAKKAGIWIPTLCYHPAVLGDGSCRLCMVEIDRGDWSQLVTACNYPVRQDIVVYVSSDKAQRARRGVMELLLARAPESQELRDLAERMGVEGTHYPTVTESQRNCILCGLCVHVCEQIIGRSAIGFAGRGVERTVAAPFRLASEDCIGCGACAAICPVGTIKVRIHQEEQEVEISPFKSRAKLLVCQECGRPIISIQVSEMALEKLKKGRKEFLECGPGEAGFDHRLRRATLETAFDGQLCPNCRKLKSAKGLRAALVHDGGPSFSRTAERKVSNSQT